jgi:hypothetical protein
METRPSDKPDRFYLSTAQRHALWENEIAMFLVLATPLIVAAFWGGWTVQVVDIYGRITVPLSLSRGVGLALLAGIVAAVGAAMYLYVQPAAVRVRNAQPVRGARRLAYAWLVGFLVTVNTSQSMPAFQMDDQLINIISVTVGFVFALVAYISMRSMVEIPAEPALAFNETDWPVRGAR